MPRGVYEITKTRKDKGTVKSNYPVEWVHGFHEGLFVAGEQKKKLPPLEVLKWLFRYDSMTGKLYRIRRSSGKVLEQERETTYVGNHGYLVVSITDSEGLGRKFQVHQLIYFMHSGEEPLQLIDHINGITNDNRFSNLRLATESLNQRNAKMQRNNTSGITGVFWDRTNEKWRAQACDISGKRKYLGVYEEKEEAAAVVSAFYSNSANNYSERHGL